MTVRPEVALPLLQMSEVSKAYGSTQALDCVSFAVARAEIVGLIGHNGAGKSTLMRTIVGVTIPDSGFISVAGDEVGTGYSMQAARRCGIRIAYQELSLAPDLAVHEALMIAAPSIGGRGWRRRSQRLLRAALDEIFPDHRISLTQSVRSLSLAQQQMLEITCATIGADEGFALLILDEPTSALAKDQADNLFRHLQRLRDRGVSTVLISHKLQEILGNTDRVVVMRDGRVVSDQPTHSLDHDRIIAAMGGVSTAASERAARSGSDAFSTEVLTAQGISDGPLREVSLRVRAGEIVGLSGLDGQGQQHLLRHLWKRRSARHGSVQIRGGSTFVTGDRTTSGVFPLWSVGQNIAVGVMRELSTFGLSQVQKERRIVEEWMSRLAVRGTSSTPIVDLSGGNQQKGLIARALAARAALVLLDDPFRGVDIETKQQVYRLMREEAAKGRGFLWFTTENAELSECDRVYVMASGRVTAELAGDDITEDAVIAASFERA